MIPEGYNEVFQRVQKQYKNLIGSVSKIDFQVAIPFIQRSLEAARLSLERLRPIVSYSRFHLILEDLRNNRKLTPSLFPYPMAFTVGFLNQKKLENMYDLVTNSISVKKNLLKILSASKLYFEKEEDLEFIENLFRDFSKGKYYSSSFFLFLSDYLLKKIANEIIEIERKESREEELLKELKKAYEILIENKILENTFIREVAEDYKNDLNTIQGALESNKIKQFNKIRIVIAFILSLSFEMSVESGDRTIDTLISFSNILEERNAIAHGEKRHFDLYDATRYITQYIATLNILGIFDGFEEPLVLFDSPYELSRKKKKNKKI